MEYTKFMADRVKTMKGSAIREMFKRMADPEIISLAGGNPASELFPGDELSKIAGKILMTNPTLALQYGTTDGYPKMKDCARKRAEKVNSVGENDEVLIMQVEGDVESEEAELVMVEDEAKLEAAFNEFLRRDEEMANEE